MKIFAGSTLSEDVADYVPPDEETLGAVSTDSEDSAKSASSSEYSENEAEDSDSESAKDLAKGNAGWADAMSKILKTNKPKKKRTIILSRAKKINETKVVENVKEDVGFEIEGEIKEEKPSIEELPLKPEISNGIKKVRRKEWEARGRVKPVYPDPEREKILSKIAIKGIVQLFNAVQKHQSEVNRKLEDAGPSEIRRERVIKSVDKRAFLDVLMGNAKSEAVDSSVKKESKIQLKSDEPKSGSWNVLRDDFMMGTNLKDWDKAPEKLDQDDNEQESLSSDDEMDVT